MESKTADGQRVNIKFTVLFRIPAASAPDVLQNVGSLEDVVENIVKATSRSQTRTSSKGYTAEELNSEAGTERYRAQVEQALRDNFAERGIELVEFNIRDIDFQEAYETAIENQQIAEEQIKTAEFQAQAAEFKRDQEITMAEVGKATQIMQAEAQAESTKLQAEADAAAKLIEAEAEAKAIAMQGAALRANPEVVQYLFVEQIGQANTIYLPSEGIVKMLPLETP